MDGSEIRTLGGGVNHVGARAHNERLILSTIQRHGELPGMEIARLTRLTAQTVSNILKKLENDGLLLRGEPNRGRIGKPSVPMAINPDGALSFGLKIGRRSADLMVMNMRGEVLAEEQTTYRYPMPDALFRYLGAGMERLSRGLSDLQKSRICGIGIAAPAEIWSWTEALDAPASFSIWRETDIQTEVARITDLPLTIQNDGTAACRAEHLFGRGREFSDYAYFFIGSFVGGGVALASKVVMGGKGNAGAFGSLRVPGPDGAEVQLLDAASLYLLENAIIRDGLDASALWTRPQDWSAFEVQLGPWIETTARALAHAIRSIGAVMDFEAVLIGGAMPEDIRARIVARTTAALAQLDTRGLIPPPPQTARVGANARTLGAAYGPVFDRYFLQ
ncbi:ROK family transcriptional regulator [Falsirhodobacter sp. alg1]|uniref:ROK family transcriptional regulator n=1 Tax=Falsirhodobacter sp. alg1 TaxID=1472418 RepID=UPI000787B157|nr:ROK family transcriptional regulator [Falsirhodobacter sp. alg1]